MAGATGGSKKQEDPGHPQESPFWKAVDSALGHELSRGTHVCWLHGKGLPTSGAREEPQAVAGTEQNPRNSAESISAVARRPMPQHPQPSAPHGVSPGPSVPTALCPRKAARAKVCRSPHPRPVTQCRTRSKTPPVSRKPSVYPAGLTVKIPSMARLPNRQGQAGHMLREQRTPVRTQGPAPGPQG